MGIVLLESIPQFSYRFSHLHICISPQHRLLALSSRQPRPATGRRFLRHHCAYLRASPPPTVHTLASGLSGEIGVVSEVKDGLRAPGWAQNWSVPSAVHVILNHPRFCLLLVLLMFLLSLPRLIFSIGISGVFLLSLSS